MNRELCRRAQDLRIRLRGHYAFGNEVGWDYDSDEVGDTRMIKDSGGFDLEISALVYDTARSRLQIRERMGAIPRRPARP